MAVTLAEISCARLREKIEGSAELVLVDALAPISYAGAHLPGAINIPPDRVDELAERRIPDRETEVVVYCANRDCESSVEVAERLVALGYRNVLHFPGGKHEWKAAGLPFEGGRV
jgi:rhodanese-related sulfurtransferase